jgi:hypothetical protein
MSDVRTILVNEFEEYQGQFVLFSKEPVRLIGLGEDAHDYYWITWNGRKLCLDSPLCRFIPLKGYIRDEDYAEMVRIAQLNHMDLSDRFDFNLDDHVRNQLKNEKIIILKSELK